MRLTHDTLSSGGLHIVLNHQAQIIQQSLAFKWSGIGHTSRYMLICSSPTAGSSRDVFSATPAPPAIFFPNYYDKYGIFPTNQVFWMGEEGIFLIA